MGVPNMSEETTQPSSNENGVRMLVPGPLLAHNRHLSVGVATRNGCKLCKEGMGSVVKSVEAPPPEPVVVQDSGADKEGDTTPAHPDGWPFTG